MAIVLCTQTKLVPHLARVKSLDPGITPKGLNRLGTRNTTHPVRSHTIPMKFRSSLLIAAVLLPVIGLVGMGQPSQAQPGQHSSTVLAQRQKLSPEERAAKREKRAAQFKQTLGLTDTQVTQIKSIRDSYRPKIKTLRQEAKTLREGGATQDQLQTLRQQRKELRKQMYNDIKAELTPEQAQKLEELKAQRKAQKRNRRRDQ